MQSLKSLITFFVLTIFLFTSCGTQRTAKEISNTLRDQKEFKSGFAGLAVYDPVEKKMLYEFNSDKYFTPASNTKLFTFFTGLKVLGDSIPALKYKKINDTLYFQGTGDPSFLNRDLPQGKVFEFLSETKNLVYVKPYYKEQFFGPGWAWDDYSDYYSAERTDFPIYGSLVEFDFASNGKLQKVKPEIFRDSVRLLESSKELPLLKRSLTSNTFYISEKAEKEEKWVPIKYSEETFVNLLQDTLKKDIQIIKAPSIELNQTFYSIPSDSLYKQMLMVSDNFIAEQILLMASEEISDTLKTRIAIDFMKENHLNDLPDKPVWVDGSGLSRYNLFTPRTMVALLEKIRQEMPEEKLFSLLPAGGERGTIKNYYEAENHTSLPKPVH